MVQEVTRRAARQGETPELFLRAGCPCHGVRVGGFDASRAFQLDSNAIYWPVLLRLLLECLTSAGILVAEGPWQNTRPKKYTQIICPHTGPLHHSTMSATTSPTFSASDLISVGDFDVWSLSSISRSITPIPEAPIQRRVPEPHDGFSDNDLIVLQVRDFIFERVSFIMMNDPR